MARNICVLVAACLVAMGDCGHVPINFGGRSSAISNSEIRRPEGFKLNAPVNSAVIRQPAPPVLFPGRHVEPPSFSFPSANNPLSESGSKPGDQKPVGISFGSGTSRPNNKFRIVFGAGSNRPANSAQNGGTLSNKPVITNGTPLFFGNSNSPHSPNEKPVEQPRLPPRHIGRPSYTNKFTNSHIPVNFGSMSNKFKLDMVSPEVNEVDTSTGSVTDIENNETISLAINATTLNDTDFLTTDFPLCSLETRSAYYNDTCYSLLEKGPCENEEWLVLSDNGTAVCQTRLCPWGQLFHNDSCVDPSDLNVCPRGQILYVDLEGSVECDCEQDYIFHPDSGNCYTQHEQGVCEDSFYMEFDENLNASCVPNPCERNDLVYFNGTCYKKNYVGYCDSYLIDVRSGTSADCISVEPFSIFHAPTLRSCVPGSKRDHLGKCRRAFTVPSQRTMSSKSGGCQFGFRKDSKGVCRKVFSLFGSNS